MSANRGRSIHVLGIAAALSCAGPGRAAGQTVERRPEPVEQRSVMYEPEPEPRYRTRSYGWQTAVLDVGAVLLFAGAFATLDICMTGCGSGANADSGALALMGLVTYGAGGPIVHATHGRPGAAMGSLGMRAAPLAIGLPLMAEENDAGAGILVTGMIAAMVFDATLLARERVPVKPPTARLQVTPVYEPRSKTGFASVGRAF
jgi:hypothetical protein